MASPGRTRGPLENIDMNVVDIQMAREKAAAEAAQAAAEALFQLKENTLKATFKHQLRGILDDVTEEQEGHARLKQQHQDLLQRHEETSQRLTILTAERASLRTQLDLSQAQVQQLSADLQAAEAVARDKTHAAQTAEVVMKEEGKLRKEGAAAAAQQVLEASAGQKQALDEVARLMQQLAARDLKVASLGEEALAASRQAQAAQAEAVRLEAVARGLGEKLAGAEAALAARGEEVVGLNKDLALIRDKYLSDLSELKAARAGAAEVASLRQHLSAAQGVTAALVEAREELREAVTALTARLASEQERARRLEGVGRVRQAVLQAIQDTPLDADPDRALDTLSAELDQAARETREAAARAAALDAVCGQQEDHIRRLACELADHARQQHDRDQHVVALQRMVAELQAELKRVAAESTIQQLGRAQSPTKHCTGATGTAAGAGAGGAAEAQALGSVAETCCTAARVCLADKGFGVRGLATRLASAPGMSLDALTAKQRGVQAAASDITTCLDDLATHLAVRPLEPAAAHEQVTTCCVKVDTCVQHLRTARDELVTAQAELLSCESVVGEVEGCLRSAAALLATWIDMSARRMAEGESLDEGLRSKMKTEVQQMEQAVHTAVSRLGAGKLPSSVLAGDAGVAAAESAGRDAQAGLLDLAARLPDRQLLSDPKLKAAVVSTELCVREAERAVSRLRVALGQAPGACASLASDVTHVMADLQQLTAPLQELGLVLKQQVDAGGDAPLDVVALQGEVLTLRSQLRDSQRMLVAMEAAGTALRPMHDSKAARGLVALDALQASERSREALQQEAGSLRAALVQQQLKHSACRLAFVGYWEDLRAAALLRTSFSAWHAATAAAQVLAAEEAISQLCEERSRQQEVTLQRRLTLASVLSRMHDESSWGLLHRTLLAWRLHTIKQVRAASNWHSLVSGALTAVDRARQMYPVRTLAQRLVAQSRALTNPWTPPLTAPGSREMLGLLLGVWRSWAHVKVMRRKAVSLSAGLPSLVAALAARRRLERAWLGWRLAVVDELVGRANGLLTQAGQQGVGRHARTSGTNTAAGYTSHRLTTDSIPNVDSFGLVEDGSGPFSDPTDYGPGPAAAGGPAVAGHLPLSYSVPSVEMSGPRLGRPTHTSSHHHEGSALWAHDPMQPLQLHPAPPHRPSQGVSSAAGQGQAQAGYAAAAIKPAFNLPIYTGAIPTRAQPAPDLIPAGWTGGDGGWTAGATYNTTQLTHQHQPPVAATAHAYDLVRPTHTSTQHWPHVEAGWHDLLAAQQQQDEAQHHQQQQPAASRHSSPDHEFDDAELEATLAMYAGMEPSRGSSVGMSRRSTASKVQSKVQSKGGLPSRPAPTNSTHTLSTQPSAARLRGGAGAAGGGDARRGGYVVNWDKAAQHAQQLTATASDVSVADGIAATSGIAAAAAAVSGLLVPPHLSSYLPHIHTLLAGNGGAAGLPAAAMPSAGVHHALHEALGDGEPVQGDLPGSAAHTRAAHTRADPSTEWIQLDARSYVPPGQQAAPLNTPPHLAIGDGALAAVGGHVFMADAGHVGSRDASQPAADSAPGQPGPYLHNTLVPEAAFTHRFAATPDLAVGPVHPADGAAGTETGKETGKETSPGNVPRGTQAGHSFRGTTLGVKRGHGGAPVAPAASHATPAWNAPNPKQKRGDRGVSAGSRPQQGKPGGTGQQAAAASLNKAAATTRNVHAQQPAATSNTSRQPAGPVMLERARRLHEAVGSLAADLHHVTQAMSPSKLVLHVTDSQHNTTGICRTTTQQEHKPASSPRLDPSGGASVLQFQPLPGRAAASGGPLPARPLLAATATGPHAPAPTPAPAAAYHSQQRTDTAAGGPWANQDAHTAHAAAYTLRQVIGERQAALLPPDALEPVQGGAGVQQPGVPVQATVPPSDLGHTLDDHTQLVLHHTAAALNQNTRSSPSPPGTSREARAVLTRVRPLQPPEGVASLPAHTVSSSATFNPSYLSGSTGSRSKPTQQRKTGGSAYAHVPSRLHQDTVATLSKRVGPGKPGGLHNLTCIQPDPPLQPIMAPLAMYMNPGSSTPGPLGPDRLLAGGLNAGLAGFQQTAASTAARAGELAGFSMVYGGNKQAPCGDTQAVSGRWDGAGSPGRALGLGEIKGLGNLKGLQHTSSPVHHQPALGTAQTLSSQAQEQLPASMVAQARPAPQAVQFTRPGAAQVQAGGEGGGPQPLTVTVHLPEPVRFSLS